ncbi:MAG: hypothetical protein EP343_22305 [Deltaproteobacteria bacterium]|nr:MAG: hypothetical protein EP343_22305 [Deltaproteobacteria bacterium]
MSSITNENPTNPPSVKTPDNGDCAPNRNKYCVPPDASATGHAHFLYFVADWIRFENIRELYLAGQSQSGVWKSGDIGEQTVKAWVLSTYGLSSAFVGELEKDFATPRDLTGKTLTEYDSTIKTYVAQENLATPPSTVGSSGSCSSGQATFCLPIDTTASGHGPLTYFLSDWVRFQHIRELYIPGASGSEVWKDSDTVTLLKGTYGLTQKANASDPDGHIDVLQKPKTQRGGLRGFLETELEQLFKGYIW